MLDKLRRGNNLGNVSPRVAALDNTLEHLQDRVGLRAAQDRLIMLVGDKKMDPILRGRVQSMVALLNLFLDKGLGYTWRVSSLIAAKSHSHGKSSCLFSATGNAPKKATSQNGSHATELTV